MGSPQFSVIIPCYNHGPSLAQSIQSVLAQTCQDFELIVVNDGSTDNTREVVLQHDDPRVRYLEQENRGATAARNAGMRSSAGSCLAFLDADDAWHPEKLRLHAEAAALQPQVGAFYNARFDMDQASNTIRSLWRPPASVTLSDLVQGFPFSPSDMVVRRDWAFRVGLFDERYAFYGDDLDFFCRLALADCRFARVNRALSYRRYSARRTIANLSGCVRDALRPLDDVFARPDCPPDVLALRGKAYAAHCTAWAGRAFAQDDTALGQELVRRAAALDPKIVEGERCPLLLDLLHASIADEDADHEALLSAMVGQLPPEFEALSAPFDWAVAYGYLLKGTRAVIWGRTGPGREALKRARALGGTGDRAYFQTVVAQLLSYEVEFGVEAARAVMRNLAEALVRAGHLGRAGRLEAEYLMGQAFRDHTAGRPAGVPAKVIRAFAKDPGWLANRGAHSILIRSFVEMLASRRQGEGTASRQRGTA